MSCDRWMMRWEREMRRLAIRRAGAWLRVVGEVKPISDAERQHYAAVNAVADAYGYARPYPDLDRFPRAAPSDGEAS